MRGRCRTWVLLGAVFLVLAAPWPADAAFPGRNGKIALTLTTTVDGPFNIDVWTVEPPATAFERLTFDPASEARPDWSPNGRWIAFSRTSAPCCASGGDIWIARSDGTGERRLTHHPGHDTAPSWSPDGTRIVFASTRNDPTPESFSDYDLFVVDSDGSGLRLLVAEPQRTEEDPAWSPDGGSIAFAARCAESCAAGVQAGIRTVSPDGSEETLITPPDFAARRPDWSPDGARIAYASGGQTRTVRPDGSDLAPLPALHPQTDPTWSPDGTRIAFSGLFLGHMNVDGSGFVPLAGANFNPGGLSWQPLGPRREDFKNGPAFCRAERDFLGEAEFRAVHRNFGGCVSAKS